MVYSSFLLNRALGFACRSLSSNLAKRPSYRAKESGMKRIHVVISLVIFAIVITWPGSREAPERATR